MQTARIDVQDSDLVSALQELAAKLLSLEAIDAILVPRRSANALLTMPTLVSDPRHLAGMDPLSPAYALNGAKVVSRLIEGW